MREEENMVVCEGRGGDYNGYKVSVVWSDERSWK